MAEFKPFLSASLDDVDLSTLRYPLMASPKLDGIRCLVYKGQAVSRNLKPIRNKYIQECLRGYPEGLDGELIVGPANGTLVMQETQSGVMSAEGKPDFKFHLFDTFNFTGSWSFSQRNQYISDVAIQLGYCEAVPHVIIKTHEELLGYEAWALEEGYEGVMLRDPSGPYKQGRSTLREGYLMKLKRSIDGEAVVIGFEEAMENLNEATIDALGHTKRSQHQDNKEGKGMVGVIRVQDEKYGIMRLQPGIMKHSERVTVWESPELLLGKRVSWRAFGYGMLNTPRFPRYYGVREDDV